MTRPPTPRSSPTRRWRMWVFLTRPRPPAHSGSPTTGPGVSTLYRVTPLTNAVTKAGLTVTIPGDGSVTGQTFNTGAGGGAFNGDNFLFVNEDGTISGWRGALGTTAEVLQPGSPANVYKGTAVGSVGGHTICTRPTSAPGAIDVLKGDAAAPTLPGSFTDPTLPSGYAPFGIAQIGNTLYVTYAKQDATKHDDDAGPGRGFVAAFDLSGNFLGRIASRQHTQLALGPGDRPGFVRGVRGRPAGRELRRRDDQRFLARQRPVRGATGGPRRVCAHDRRPLGTDGGEQRPRG